MNQIEPSMSGKTKIILIISIIIVSVGGFFASLRADTISNHRFFVMTSDRLDALSRARREKDLEGQSKWKVSGYDKIRVGLMEQSRVELQPTIGKHWYG